MVGNGGKSSRQGHFSPSLSQNRTWKSPLIRLLLYKSKRFNEKNLIANDKTGKDIESEPYVSIYRHYLGYSCNVCTVALPIGQGGVLIAEKSRIAHKV